LDGTDVGEPHHEGEVIPSTDDAALIAQLREGDAQGLATLVDLHFDALIRFAYYLVGSRDAAQDVVQDVFVRLWEHPELFTVSRSLKQYLYAAVRNHALDIRKYESVRARHREMTQVAAVNDVLLTETPSPEDAILTVSTVQDAIRKLPDRRQLAVRLRIEQELSHAEIGQILGISTGAAERLVLRALEALREILRVSG
jgi:RNA polymerase sigma-70 factor (ECF subfamily)